METKLVQQQKLAKALNLEFDEIADLFSVETLESFKMEEAIGGNGNLPSPRGIFDICPNLCPTLNVACPSINGCPDIDVCPGTDTSCGGNKCGGTAGPAGTNCLCDMSNTCGTSPRPTPLTYCG